MAYWLFLDHVVFPVAPEKITTKINNKNETIDLIDGSEINLLKKPGLTEYEFKLLLPMSKYPFAHYDNGFLDARYYLDVLERLKLEKRHFQFDLYREMPGGKKTFDTNATVSLEEYTITEDAEEGLDVTVEIELKQYRPYGTRIYTITDSEDGGQEAVAVEETQRQTDTAPVVTTYTVVSGDCLWNIAKRYLGDGSRWGEIYELNREQIASPDLIYPGQVFVIP